MTDYQIFNEDCISGMSKLDVSKRTLLRPR